MTRKRAVDRPTLARIEANETALIWNPSYGFRLAVPRKARKSNMTLQEMFLGVMLSKTEDESYMQNVAAQHFDRVTKH